MCVVVDLMLFLRFNLESLVYLLISKSPNLRLVNLIICRYVYVTYWIQNYEVFLKQLYWNVTTLKKLFWFTKSGILLIVRNICKKKNQSDQKGFLLCSTQDMTKYICIICVTCHDD